MRICVYCASSSQSDPVYREAAHELGAILAGAGHTIAYGGGGHGSMGALANGALTAGGEVTGIMPNFMADLEWAHPRLTTLQRVDTMHQRKAALLEGADAVVALPGGCGTLEELLEAITLKRLGLYTGAIVLLDTRGFYQPLTAFLEHSIAEHFMNPEHAGMWQMVARPDAVLSAIAHAPAWSEAARDSAVVHG